MFLLHCKNLQDISRKSPQCVVSNVKEGPFSGFFFFYFVSVYLNDFPFTDETTVSVFT